LLIIAAGLLLIALDARPALRRPRRLRRADTPDAAAPDPGESTDPGEPPHRVRGVPMLIVACRGTGRCPTCRSGQCSITGKRAGCRWAPLDFA